MLLGSGAQVVELETAAVPVNPAQEVPRWSTFVRGGSDLVAPARDRVRVWDLDGPPDAPPSGDTLLPPNTSVLQAASDERGQLVVFGTSAGDLYMVDLARNSLASAPIRHGGQAIAGMEMSPQADAVAVVDAAGLVRVWSVPSGVPRTPPLRHPEPVSSLAWRPDGRQLAVATLSGDITVWDLSARTSRTSSDAGTIDVSLAPDGRRMLAWGIGDGVSVWDLDERPPRATARLPLENVCAAAWHRDGTRVALIVVSAGAASYHLHVWDLSAGLSEPLELTGQYRWETSANTLAFAADGEALIFCTYGGPVRFDPARTAQERGLQGYTPSPGSPMCGAASSRFLAACARLTDESRENILRVWSHAGELVLETPLVAGIRVSCLTFSPDGSLLVAAGDLGVHMWRTSDWQPVPLDAVGRTAGVTLACFDGNGRRLALVDRNALCRVVQLDEPILGGAPFQLSGTPRQLAFSSDGKRLAAVTTRHGVTVWDWLRGQPVTPALCREHSIKRALFTPDDSTLALVLWARGLEWLPVPQAAEASVEDLLTLSRQITGYSLAPDGESRYLWAPEWQRLDGSSAARDGEMSAPR
jgi:WD40 repeat protein